MRSFRFLVLGLALAVALGLAFFGRGAIVGFFGQWGRSLGASADRNFTYENFKNLETENAGLKAELQNYLRLKGATSTPLFGAGKYRFVTAETYSRYPWNDYASIVIGAGADEGLKPGMPVMAGDGVLLGKVASVAGTQSDIETIFDPNWKSSVVIGAGRVTALLSGGSTPGLDLIPRNAGVNAGDTILNVDPTMPLNLVIGEVTKVESDPASLWTKAELSLPWDPAALNRVYVITNFP